MWVRDWDKGDIPDLLTRGMRAGFFGVVLWGVYVKEMDVIYSEFENMAVERNDPLSAFLLGFGLICTICWAFTTAIYTIISHSSHVVPIPFYSSNFSQATTTSLKHFGATASLDTLLLVRIMKWCRGCTLTLP